jgi:hypothetical protein
MAIQQPESPVGRSEETFPANENSLFPSKGTTQAIVGATLGIAVIVAIFAMASPKVGPGNEMTTTPNAISAPTQQQPSPPGAHDQQ